MQRAAMMNQATRLLEHWAEWAASQFAPLHGNPPLRGYGPGYLTWGVQSNWNALAALATLAAQPGVREPERWRAAARDAFRLALATHVTGGRTGPDGRPWGHGWISMLGIERAMHGVRHLTPFLEPADTDAFRRMLVSEAEWLLRDAERAGHHGVFGAKWNHTGRNVPESNIWSGCLLWRAAECFPDEPDAAAWRERAHAFLINGISVEADAEDETVIAGKPVRERHAGANYFPHFALDHHGYLNVGYMAICVSNAAILHFDARSEGFARPETLDHRQAEHWNVLRRMVFADGRLARIGGDSRVRYAYCQEYLLPTLLYAADRLGDPHALGLAARQLDGIEHEAAAQADGSFYGTRLTRLRTTNPHYFTRLESDRAVVLAMLLNYLPLVTSPPAPSAAFEADVAGEWVEEEHGAALVRSPRRFASFAWRARELGQALCLPPGDSSLAEWSRNLCPVVRFLGDRDPHGTAHRRLRHGRVQAFPGGLIASGAIDEGVNVRIDEGGACTDQAVTRLAFTALPDDRTTLVLQRVVAAPDRCGFIEELKGLHLNIPNDLYNGGRRLIRAGGFRRRLDARARRDAMLPLPGRWAHIDDALGVVLLYGGDGMVIDRSAEPRGGPYASLRVEELCTSVRRGPERVRPGAVLLDLGAAVLAGTDPAETATLEAHAIEELPESVRGVRVTGADRQIYVFLANVSDEDVEPIVDGQTIPLPAGDAALLRADRDPGGARPDRLTPLATSWK